MFIKKVIIKNFRSIENCSIELNNLNILYGMNDVGKSNLLKALNLFFNNKISHNEEFDFDKDFCAFATVPNKKAKEIQIEIILQPPESYSDNQEFSWKKVWRKDGLYYDSLYNIENRRNRKYTWAKKIVYRYIPAMKDDLYFSNLLAELYKVLTSSVTSDLTEASDNFLSVIRNSTKTLSDDLYQQLNFRSEIALPQDLSSLFSILDFKTNKNKKNISIKNRGDGIKTRHIPSILKFFHLEMNKDNNRGTIRTDTIWGYEEPENNLEGLAAFELSSQFINISEEIQILATTHSPAFYLVKEQYENCNLIRAIQNDKDGTLYKQADLVSNKDPYHDEFLAMIAPFVQKERDKIKSLTNKIEELDKNEDIYRKHIIFVEGKSDKLIIDNYLKNNELQSLICVIACESANGVLDYIKSWLFNPRHEGNYPYYIMGLVDNDSAGAKVLSEYKQFKESIRDKRIKSKLNNIHTFKCLNSTYLGTNLISKLGDNFTITIETLFDSNFWKYGIDKNWVIKREDKEVIEMLSNKMNDVTCSAKDWLESQKISEDDSLYIYYKVRDESKMAFAKYIEKSDMSNKFSSLEENLEKFIKKINRVTL